MFFCFKLIQKMDMNFDKNIFAFSSTYFSSLKDNILVSFRALYAFKRSKSTSSVQNLSFPEKQFEFVCFPLKNLTSPKFCEKFL